MKTTSPARMTAALLLVIIVGLLAAGITQGIAQPTPLPTLPPVQFNPPPYDAPPFEPSPADGWSCGDFPCADDLAGWMQRIRVPAGYQIAPVGRFPGQVTQIAYGIDGRLYGVVLENGTRSGAVYAMDADGNSVRFSEAMPSPHGIAVQPGTGDLFVTGRVTPLTGGAVYRVPAAGGVPIPFITDLPCCYQAIDNQPAGITFDSAGALYVGTGGLTDRNEAPPRAGRPPIVPGEAAIVRIETTVGGWTPHADGIRYPVDLTTALTGALYALDNGVVGHASLAGDRVLRITPGGFYGWPYWTGRGCDDCPAPAGRGQPQPDLLTLPIHVLPRGIVVYSGRNFPANQIGMLFVSLWNDTPDGQRVIRIDPTRLPPAGESGMTVNEGYTFEPFVTGLLRPADVIVASDGGLIIADYVYGQVWRVSYSAGNAG